MINLLPAKIKKEQKLGQLSRQINTAILALVIMVGLSYSAVYFVNFYLSSQVEKNNELLNKTKVEITRLKPVEDDITNINAKLTKLSTLDSARYDWSTVLADINNSVPKNIQIQSISIDTKTSRITLSAAAETRSDIVKLQAQLEALPYFKNLAFESSVFSTANNNYTFGMTGTLEKTK